jgi:hypothetical protein
MAPPWPSQLFRWLGFARYNVTAPVGADGQVAELQGDAAGRLRTTTQGEKPTGLVISPALETHRQVVVGAGALVELYGFNDDTATKYLMLFDAASLPGNGASGWLARFRIAGGGSIAFAPGYPLAFTSGLIWAASTTADTLTIDTGNHTDVAVAYL